jgi:REP element-mobilizing transposase RayT
VREARLRGLRGDSVGMRRSYNCVHVHFVWGTWDRLPLITPEAEPRLYAAILAKCRELKCPVLALGGVEDHVHLLVRLHPSVSPAQLMRDVKGSSSHLISHEITPGGFFEWQGSYDAFAVEEDRLPTRVNYIRRQKEHHRDGTQDEILETVFITLDPPR